MVAIVRSPCSRVLPRVVCTLTLNVSGASADGEAVVPAQLHRRVLIVLAVGLTGLGGLALAAHPAKPFAGRGVTTTARILGTFKSGDEPAASVQFATASGAPMATNIVICHHQSYAVGNAIDIVYDAANPRQALEKEMIRQPIGVRGVFMMEVIAGAVLLAIAAQRRTRVWVPPAAATEEVESLIDDDELRAFLEDARLEPEAEELVDA